MKTGATWSNPVNMRIEEDVNLGTVINSHLSPDGRVMISSRQSPDTYGGNDLYVSFRVGADAWSKPQNIGAVVNTHGMEMGPFIAGDNETMFFSSNGHPGFGGRDLYVTRRLDSTWLRWSEPKNLGPSYNSAGHETFIQVPAHGDSAYFSARLGNGIGDDIVALAMPKGAQPKATYTIIGEVVDGESNTPVSAEVKLVLMPSERFEAATTNDRSTGKFSVDVATASLYQVQVNVPGFKPFRATVDARGMQRYTAMTTKIVLERAEIPLRRDTSSVTFAHGKAEVEPVSFASLDSLAAYMRRAPKAKLVLQGHADEIGTPGANQQLSMERANAILERLMAAGIDPSRVTVVGYGESRPRASNATDEGRAQNRRVDVILR
jgi:outer membrane protein OmpA-like peptidoglycan-associated protein